MEKPLRSSDELFFSLVDGRISALAADEAWVVVEAANQSLRRGPTDRILVLDQTIVFEDSVLGWLERIADNEPLNRLADELNEQIRAVSYIRIINVDELGDARWENIAVMRPDTATELKAAHAVSLFLASGNLKRLRRCQADGCTMFFLGPPNKKWCSAGCGARMRGRHYRKKRRKQRYAV